MKLNTYSVMLALIGLAVLLPWTDSAYLMRLGTLATMYSVLAVSWTIVGGFTGYPSFATAAFFGFGAYAGGILLAQGWPLPLAVLCAALLAFVLALLLGSVLLRLKGHYFAIGSLAVVEVLRELANSSTELTGGGMGLNVPMNTGGGIAATAAIFYWAMWLLLLMCFLLARWIERSKLGFGLACIRQNEAAADMIGVNATLYKSLAFGFSAVFVGAAGAVYAAWVNYIEPADVFDVLLSVKPIVMALIGGLGSIGGAVAGALVFLGLEETLWRNMLEMHSAALGVLVVLLLLFLPHGLASLPRRFARAGSGAAHD
ncbi:branched-chain amino acid ABC transporter permease [Ottowia sp. VDI28]|uniref:branched-chain amino acid ABC transporter permease n=1 Tax=Ottowia sp. VDI28 TaxID=3133968 RepID=UPI003C2C042D